MNAVRRQLSQAGASLPAVFGVAVCLLGAAPVSAAALTISAYPSPGVNVASERSEISFVGLKSAQLGPIEVVGTESGRHGGKLASHSGQKGVSFLPRRPFLAGEKVTVRTRHKIRGAGRSFSFRIGNFKTQAARPPAGIPREGNIPPQATSYRSRPDLKAPLMIVDTPASSDVGPGYVFLAPKQNGPMIVDNRGDLVYYRPGIETADFKVQRYRGRPVLTWWQGPFNAGGYTEGIFVIADQSYKVIARVRSGNGYRGDLHEFKLTPRGTAFVPAYRAVLMDLSKIGGPKRAAVLDSVAQEIDIRTGRVVWEWHSIGRVGLKESKVPVPQTAKQAFDYFHINSIDEDRDGNIIISARNTSAIYKVSKATGKVLWRLNGTHSSFAGEDIVTAWQHDARPLPGGLLSIYDNGAAPPVHQASRGLVLALDSKNKKARVVRTYTHPKKLLAGSQGNMQTLDNGNVMIGWGSEPYFTEFSADGRVLFDAHYAARNSSYRTYRMPWTGRPETRPAAASARLKKGSGGSRVWVSWNGDTRTRSWRILGGSKSNSMRRLIDVERDGFETAITLGSAPRFLAAVALDGDGKRIGRSANLKLGSRVR